MKIDKKRPWIAFYSHTGSEIVSLSRALGVRPDIVCTNNSVIIDAYSDSLYKRNVWKPDDYRKIFNEYENPLITLHGWMKIVPGEICNEYEIYNGHPALIDKYPELKGKDMQEAVVNRVKEYPIIGSVIHECIPELDSGKVVISEQVYNIEVSNKAIIYDILKDTSFRSWMRFLPDKLQ